MPDAAARILPEGDALIGIWKAGKPEPQPCFPGQDIVFPRPCLKRPAW